MTETPALPAQTASVITASSQALRSLQPQQATMQPGAAPTPVAQQTDGFDLGQVERLVGTIERLMNGPVGQIVIQAYKRKTNPSGEQDAMFPNQPAPAPQPTPAQPSQPQAAAPAQNPRQQCDGFIFGLRVVNDEEFKAKVLAQLNELHTHIARHTAKQLKHKATVVLQAGDDQFLQQLQGLMQVIMSPPSGEAKQEPGKNGKSG